MRRLPIGAEVRETGADFRVWCPLHRRVAVALESGSATGLHQLTPDAHGYFPGFPPDASRRFVDAAPAAGLGVILDVVYNHFGPDGNYLAQFSTSYITHSHGTDWGDAINYDGPDSGPVREFFIANAGYWVEEFHLD